MQKRFMVMAASILMLAVLPLALPAGRNLEYEYVLVFSLLTIYLVPLLALFQPWVNGATRQETLLTLAYLLVFIPALALLPAVLLRATGSCPCSPYEYYFWIGLQWYPAWLVAFALHQLLSAVTCRLGRRKRYAVLLYAGVNLLAFLAFAAELWWSPQKRITHLLAGFIHGPIYDDWIPVDPGIMLRRASHGAFALFLISVAWLKSQWPARGACLLLFLAASGLYLKSCEYPSARNGIETLKKVMPYRLRGEFFTMHFKADLLQPEGEIVLAQAPASIRTLYREAEFHSKELRTLLPGSADHVAIFVYPNREAMKLWFGGERTDITDVRLPSIHIKDEEFPHPSLRHELVHALSSAFGYHGLGFHPNIAFTEGLAMALAPDAEEVSLDEGAAALLKSGMLPNVEQLFSPFFWGQAGRRAYTVAGSLVSYIMKHYGVDAVRQLYNGASWQQATGKPATVVVREWQEFLASFGDEKAITAEALYRYPGVLHDLCPHSNATLRQERISHFSSLRRPTNWQASKDYLPWLEKLKPEDLSVKFRVLVAKIRRRLLEDRAVDPRVVTPWLEEVRSLKVWPPRHVEDVEMAILESDLLRWQGHKKASMKLLADLLANQETIHFSDSLLRQIKARLMLEEATDDPEALIWRRYLATLESGIPEAPADAWIFPYLRLRRGGYQAEELDYLRGLLPLQPPSGLAKTFFVEWFQYLGLRLFELGDYAAAAQAFQEALPYTTTGNRDFIAMLARMASAFTANADP